MTGPTQFPRPYIAMRKQGQRRKDHGARRREAEWRAYQALWQKPIDKLRTPSGDDFYSLRRNILMLNRKQCARLLRCGVQSVLNWETGRHPVPFYAYLALLLTSESVHYRLASDAWKDWDFIERLPENAFDRPKRGGSRYITEMVNRKTGAHFTPDELCRYHMQIQQLRMLESQVRELHEKVSALTRRTPRYVSCSA
jgi:DNA-binding transcriptional regulator YiaG